MFIGFYNVSVILSYLGVSFSVVGMVFAFLGNIPAAMMCLILAGVCDMFDGTVARATKRNEREKNFGIQLDSLIDIVSFGAFPIIIGISLGLTSTFNIITYILFAVAAVIRLAYFNVLSAEKSLLPKKEKSSYYYGLPVTSVAIILPFVYNLKLFLSPETFFQSYQLVMLVTAILFILNIKIKKPTGIWYVICSILAAIEIAIIMSMMR
ncbi:MAG: CDP-alcohol phosphatidyltransferase family protein [Bacilli bacterium]